MFRPYFIKNTYSAQIEGWALLGLRIDGACLGLAWWPRNAHRVSRWMPHIYAAFNAHTAQCDQRWVFKFTIGNVSFGYRTKGDATPDMATYYDAGWHLAWKNKRLLFGKRREVFSQ